MKIIVNIVAFSLITVLALGQVPPKDAQMVEQIKESKRTNAVSETKQGQGYETLLYMYRLEVLENKVINMESVTQEYATAAMSEAERSEFISEKTLLSSETMKGNPSIIEFINTMLSVDRHLISHSFAFGEKVEVHYLIFSKEVLISE